MGGMGGRGGIEGGMEQEVICLFYEHIIIVSLQIVVSVSVSVSVSPQIQRKQTEARAPTVLWTAATNTLSKSQGISNEGRCFYTQRKNLKSERAGEREREM